MTMTPRLLLAGVLLLPPTAAVAQADPTPTPTPVPTPVPGSLGRMGGFSLPASGQSAAPSPPPPLVLPVPTPTPTPTPSATPTNTRATPPRTVAPPTAPTRVTPSATPTPSPTDASPLPSAAAPTVPAAEAPTQSPVPSPLPSSTEPLVAERGGNWLWWLIALVGIAVLAVVFLLIRRSRQPLRLAAPETDPIDAEPSPEGAIAPPPPTAPPPATPISRADHRSLIAIEFRPSRAGLNLLTALVEGELTIVNEGETPLDRIALATTLVSADHQADADLAAFVGQPIGRPAVPPFALAPGERRTVRIVAPLARASLRTMTAANRPIFVPIVAVACRFVSRGDECRTARAFTVGIERVDSAKLAPIWLDVAPRMYDAVAARPYALKV